MLSKLKNFVLLAMAATAAFSMAALVMTDTALSQDGDDYSPAYTVGSDADDWWTTYPDQHENSGSEVVHPDWVLEALKEKPVLILIHSSNCVPCLTQMPRIQEAVQSFAGDLKYYDVLAEGSGFERAVNILDVYNPSGGAQYVPTTIFITLAPGPDGAVDVAWHSQIDAMSQEKIEAYVKDSIYYHEQNRAAWV